MYFKKPEWRGSNIRAINLDQPVIIYGRDFFGRNSSIEFIPVEKFGWWRKSGDNKYEKIAMENIQAIKRRLCFSSDDRVWLNHPEHITALRLLGLDKVAISCESSWPPYLFAGEIWNKLTKYLVYADYCLEWNNFPKETTEFICNNRFTRISPANEEIIIELLIDYSSVGKYCGSFIHSNVAMEDNGTFEEILLSRTQGWPKQLYYLSKMVSMLGWPHHEKICWSNEKSVIEQFGKHRIADILGAVGAVSLVGNKLLACKVESIKGGHLSDLKAFKKAFL